MGEKVRVDKLLSNMGKGSRNEVRDALKYGQVKVNGNVVKSGKIKVDVAEDEVLFQGIKVCYQKNIYLMMNKPQGVISATEDNRHKTVIDLLQEDVNFYNVFPVGRLDIDTEGLLLLTDDGDLAHNLLSPKKHVPKLYYAKIDAQVTDLDVKQFAEGITIDDGYRCKPAQLHIISANASESEIELVIYEGKFHQVKRMFEAVEKNVLFLKRMKMGTLSLDETLDKGAYRELTEAELEGLRTGHMA
ncbi:pseudouridine synthase [Fusibacter sp. 3D3]|uniref:pseudouridine synthase n=1 Tax=Fusibacter sp. 3D3 TaxID=1048380 RepID=UPI000853C697|nr:pseudouridine synthase [Fusibacter sp. 3D3]GAU79472.1 ribosomal small subunit pseudouridine synthase A [Fusibacter sp. 3D3]